MQGSLAAAQGKRPRRWQRMVVASAEGITVPRCVPRLELHKQYHRMLRSQQAGGCGAPLSLPF